MLKKIIQTKRRGVDNRGGKERGREGEKEEGSILTESNYVATNSKLCRVEGAPTLAGTSMFI